MLSDSTNHPLVVFIHCLFMISDLSRSLVASLLKFLSEIHIIFHILPRLWPSTKDKKSSLKLMTMVRQNMTEKQSAVFWKPNLSISTPPMIGPRRAPK